MGRACSTHWSSAYSISRGNHEEKKLLGRSEHRCEDNIKIYQREIGCVLDPSGTEQRLVAGCCEHGT
jgi:hypothetical protein